MANYYFPFLSHSGHHKPKFPVAMRTLVQIHEIHIYFPPGNFGIELGMKMANWFFQKTQASYPHFGGRKGVHPGDYSNTLLLAVGQLKQICNLVGSLDRIFVDYL